MWLAGKDDWKFYMHPAERRFVVSLRAPLLLVS